MNILFFITSLDFEKYHRKKEIEAIEQRLKLEGGEALIYKRPVFILTFLLQKLGLKQKNYVLSKARDLYVLLPLSIALKISWLTKIFIAMPIKWQINNTTKKLKGTTFNWIYKPDQFLYISNNYIYLHYDNYADDPDYFFNKSSQFEVTQYTVIKNSTISLFTSNILYNKYRRLMENCYYYPNAIARSLIEKCTASVHINIEPKVIGFVGQIDQSFDYELVLKIAAAYPNYQIVLIGPIKQSEITEKLSKLSNIQLKGYVAYDKLGEHIQRFSIGICPYKTDSFSQYRNPLKVYEYFSFGIPVITTTCDLSEDAKSLLVMAENHQEFIDSIALQCDFNTTTKVLKRIDFSKSNGWDNRADFLIKCLGKKLGNN